MSGAHLVFVYGSLKNGFHNHGILERGKSDFLGTFKTLSNTYKMLHLGGFPGVVFNHSRMAEDKQLYGQVEGELYHIDNACMANLDHLEGHPNFYERFQVKLEGFEHNAWMYLLPEDNDHHRYVAPDLGILRWEDGRMVG